MTCTQKKTIGVKKPRNTWLQKFSEYMYCHVNTRGIKKQIIFKWYPEDICHWIYSDIVGSYSTSFCQYNYTQEQHIRCIKMFCPKIVSYVFYTTFLYALFSHNSASESYSWTIK